MKKIILCIFMCFACGCQLQVPIASTVLTVNKVQVSKDEAKMSGSNLDEVGQGADIDNSADIPSVR